MTQSRTETDESMIDTTLNELEDAGNEIDGAVHSPAYPLNQSMEEATRDPSFEPGSECL